MYTVNWEIPEFTHAFPMLAEVSGWFTFPLNRQILEFTHAFPMLAEVSGWFTFPWIGKFRSLHMHFRCLRKFPADLHSHESANSGVYTCISDAYGSFGLIYIPMNRQIPDRTNAFRILAEVSGWFTFPWIGKFRSLHMHFRCLRKFPAELHSHESANSGAYKCISNTCGSFDVISIGGL
jgi:hypothetical protein